MNCNSNLLKGSKVNVAKAIECSLSYAVEEGDTCDSIRYYFDFQDQDRLDGPVSPNPNLDSSNLQPFQQICIKDGSLPFWGPCTRPYKIMRGETCPIIIRKYMQGDARKFFTLNPGIYCGHLQRYSSDYAFTQEVCLERVDLGGGMQGCYGTPVTLATSHTCSYLNTKYFKDNSKTKIKPKSFKTLNSFACTKRALVDIRAKAIKSKTTPKICTPKREVTSQGTITMSFRR